MTKHRLAELGSDGTIGGAGGSSVNWLITLDSYYDNAIYASKTAAINAAVAAAQLLNGTLKFRHGRIYSLDTGFLSIAPGSALTIEGNGATLQSNWGSQHMIDFTRTAPNGNAGGDYGNWADIKCNLILDANNQVSGHSESVVGNLSAGNWSNRQNFDRINFDCKWINVPVGGGATVTECFALAGKHLGSGETQTHLRNIYCKGYMRGGDVGAAVIGTGVSGATNAGVEVYHDQIYIDIDHDTGVIPSSGSSGGANVQIGSVGWGDYCEVRVRGANSGDVGVEIDGMMTAVVTGTIIDAKNAMFYARNFHPPRSVTAQKNTFQNTVAITRNVDKGTIGGTSKDYAVGGDSTGNFAFGEFVMDNCQSQCETALADWTNSTAMFLSVDQMYVRRVKIIGTYKIGCSAMAQAAATGHIFIYNNLWTADPRGVLEVDAIAMDWAGMLGTANSGIVHEVLRMSSTSGQTTRRNIGPVSIDASGITGAATNNTLKVIHDGVNASSFFVGPVHGMRATNGSVGSWTAMNLWIANANFHTGGTNSKTILADGDSSLWTSSAGNDYQFSSAQYGMIKIVRIAGRRATGSPFVLPTSVTPPGSGVAYQNPDGFDELITSTGGTLTGNLLISPDNFTTTLDLGAQAGTFLLPAGWYMKFGTSYSGAPTITKSPTV